jgi:primosomal protein N' (replication factor Y)
LPPELEMSIAPGHLVWAPFGRQQVQGIVMRRVERAPVPTKPITRLARPDPVLTPAQIELAAWIAGYYAAAFPQVIKLFLPPGLLQRDEEKQGVRARREVQVSLVMATQEAAAAVHSLRRENPATRLLTWLLAHPGERPRVTELVKACRLSSPKTIHVLVDAGALHLEDDLVLPAVSQDALEQELTRQAGVARLEAIVLALQEAGEPLWKSDLNARAPCDLATLRTLQQAGVVTLTEQVRFRDPLLGRAYPPTTPLPLTPQQDAVWRALMERAFVEEGIEPRFTSFLLHGVTGSGKTEIYLRAIAETLAHGRQAIVLVPEIALTPQTIARFAGRFPNRVTVIHSELSKGERYDVWRALRAGQFDVVVGPRSALFAPLQKLGLIVVDEEHENSYKQDSEEWGNFTVFYDARTVAQRLAQLTNSVLISGSATPRLESYAAAMRGECMLLEMPRRVMGHREAAKEEDNRDVYAELPPVEIVDMRQELRAGNRSIFSRSLAAHLQAGLDAGEQSILFLNRRGANTFILCRDCGYVEECPRCGVPLVYHEREGRLVCHHCDRLYPLPTVCPKCKSKRIKYFGSGTEQIETLVREIAPRARLLRWDADTTGRKGSHEAIMHQFARHEADILIGTQMIAKGLDLPLVTLVGVISADVGLHLPDFRSSERTFQLLTQVAGRAGRSERGGRVVIQTYTPQHYAIQAAAQHDYTAFYRREIAFRQEQGYPPARRMARLVYWDKKPEKAKETAQTMARRLHRVLEEMGVEGKTVGILGPTPAFFAKYRGYYRWQLLLRAPDPAAVLQKIDIPLGWRVDIDPVTVL